MIDPKKNHAQWQKEKTLLASTLQIRYLEQQDCHIDAPWTPESEIPTPWHYFIHPLLNGLYANDPNVSFCSYMWGFYEALDALIRDQQDFDIQLFSEQIMEGYPPPIIPVFHKKPGSEEEDLPFSTILPLRALRHITQPNVDAAYAQQIYSLLRWVSLKIILRCLWDKDLKKCLSLDEADQLALYQYLTQMLDKLKSTLGMSEAFRGNVLMPLMDDLACLYLSFSHEDEEAPNLSRDDIFSKISMIL